MQEVILAQLAQHRGQTAGIAEVLHQVLAVRHQVDERMHAAARSVPVVERQLDADAPRDGDEMDHRIGRAADRGIGADRVLERRLGQDLRQAHVLLHELDDAPPRHAREHIASCIDRGVSGVAGHGDTERLHHRRHGRGGAHGHAVAVRSMHARFRLMELVERDFSGAQFLGHRPDVGARADVVAAILAREHRPARDEDGGDVDARRAHQDRGRGLVAAAEQHHAVERIAADRLLGVHARQIAVEHGGRPQQRLAQRHHRKFEREAARFEDAIPYMLRQDAEVRVARREL